MNTPARQLFVMFESISPMYLGQEFDCHAYDWFRCASDFDPPDVPELPSMWRPLRIHVPPSLARHFAIGGFRIGDVSQKCLTDFRGCVDYSPSSDDPYRSFGELIPTPDLASEKDVLHFKVKRITDGEPMRFRFALLLQKADAQGEVSPERDSSVPEQLEMSDGRRSVIFDSYDDVPPNGTVTIPRVVYQPFRGDRIIVPESIGRFFTIMDIRVGTMSQLATEAGIPAEALGPSVEYRFRFDIAKELQQISLVVLNHSKEAKRFRAMVHGRDLKSPGEQYAAELHSMRFPVRETSYGFDSILPIAAGAFQTVHVICTDAFRGRKFEIPERIASAFSIHEVRIGPKIQFSCVGGVSARQFEAYIEAEGVKMDTAQTGEQIRITVRNISDKVSMFFAELKGESPARAQRIARRCT